MGLEDCLGKNARVDLLLVREAGARFLKEIGTKVAEYGCILTYRDSRLGGKLAIGITATTDHITTEKEIHKIEYQIPGSYEYKGYCIPVDLLHTSQ